MYVRFYFRTDVCPFNIFQNSLLTFLDVKDNFDWYSLMVLSYNRSYCNKVWGVRLRMGPLNKLEEFPHKWRRRDNAINGSFE